MKKLAIVTALGAALLGCGGGGGGSDSSSSGTVSFGITDAPVDSETTAVEAHMLRPPALSKVPLNT